MLNPLKRFVCMALLILTLSLLVSATDINTYIFDYSLEEITIIFSEETSFSEDKRKAVADSIVYDIPISQTYSLCWLLGHDTVTETVTAVYHKKSVYDPRCQLEIYDITSCTNCDYVYPRLVNSTYISCCPPDSSAISLD